MQKQHYQLAILNQQIRSKNPKNWVDFFFKVEGDQFIYWSADSLTNLFRL